MVLGVLLRVGAAVAAIAAVAWKATVPRRLGRARAGPCLENRTYDVIVVGGGVMGVWTAIAAKRQAESVCLLEQYDAGHHHGSSHGDGRIYRFAYAEELYVDMMNLSLVDWRLLSDASGGGVLSETGGVSLYGSPPEAGETSYDSHGSREHLAALYKKKGLAHSTWTADELEAEFPQFRPRDRGTLALFQPNFGVLFAGPAIAAAWAYARRLGVDASEWTAVDRVHAATDASGGAPTVRSGAATYAGRAVVVAPGSWLTAAAKDWFGVDIPTEITAETVSYFAPRSRTDPSIPSHGYADMPVFISDSDNGLGPYGYYGLPIVDVPGVKVSAHHSGFELKRDGSTDRPLAVNGNGSSPEDEAAAALRTAQIVGANVDFVKKFFPHLNPTPFLNDHCIYTSTPDLDYVIDAVPNAPGVVLAGGGSGHAFKMGPAIGAAAAALALGKEPPFDVAKFRIDRPGLARAGVDARRP